VQTQASDAEESRTMELTTKVSIDDKNSVARVWLIGALNSDTAPTFEEQLQAAIAKDCQLTVLDMKSLDYISSAGLRVIFKAAKQCKSEGRRLAAANRKPHIDKVFEILKALPDMAVFANDQELDDYLDLMQYKVRHDS
jgi:anti-anti-sigma factor